MRASMPWIPKPLRTTHADGIGYVRALSRDNEIRWGAQVCRHVHTLNSMDSYWVAKSPALRQNCNEGVYDRGRIHFEQISSGLLQNNLDENWGESWGQAFTSMR